MNKAQELNFHTFEPTDKLPGVKLYKTESPYLNEGFAATSSPCTLNRYFLQIYCQKLQKAPPHGTYKQPKQYENHQK